MEIAKKTIDNRRMPLDCRERVDTCAHRRRVHLGRKPTAMQGVVALNQQHELRRRGAGRQGRPIRVISSVVERAPVRYVPMGML